MKLATITFLTFFFGILHSQSNFDRSNNLYFCFPVDDVFYMDEGRPSSLESIYMLIDAYKINTKNGENEILLTHKNKEIVNLTDININEKYYISTDKGVYESYVIGYKIINYDYIMEFYVVLKPTSNYISEQTQNKSKHFICSKNKLFNNIINNEVTEVEIRGKTINEIYKYTKLVKEKKEGEEGFKLNIYHGSF